MSLFHKFWTFFKHDNESINGKNNGQINGIMKKIDSYRPTGKPGLKIVILTIDQRSSGPWTLTFGQESGLLTFILYISDSTDLLLNQFVQSMAQQLFFSILDVFWFFRCIQAEC